MLRREKELKVLQNLADLVNSKQTLFFCDAQDEDDLYVVFLQDAETMDVLRIFNGDYKACKEFIKSIPIITRRKVK